MSDTTQHNDQIKLLWQKMETMEDLIDLLNLSKKKLFGEKAFDLEKKNITFYLAPERRSKGYREFSIKKKSGGVRSICAPNPGLLQTQKALNYVLQVIGEVHDNAFGFVPGKNIANNAALHVGKAYVLNIDIKDFFPSVEQSRVWARLQYPPFGLSGSRKELANAIATLVSHNMTVQRLDESSKEWVEKERSVLPQGAPTSPTITNFICNRLDRKMMGIAKRFGLVYSRYADDITFSSDHYVYDSEGEFFKELRRVVIAEGFHLQEKKVRLQCKPYRQEVTGIIVNEKLNLRKKYIKEVRMWLYMWERYGLLKASILFKKHYEKDGRREEKELIHVLPGKIHFIRMVKGEEDPTYLKLRGRYWKLIGKSQGDKKGKEKVTHDQKKEKKKSIKRKEQFDLDSFIEDLSVLGFDGAIEKHL